MPPLGAPGLAFETWVPQTPPNRKVLNAHRKSDLLATRHWIATAAFSPHNLWFSFEDIDSASHRAYFAPMRNTAISGGRVEPAGSMRADNLKKRLLQRALASPDPVYPNAILNAASVRKAGRFNAA